MYTSTYLWFWSNLFQRAGGIGFWEQESRSYYFISSPIHLWRYTSFTIYMYVFGQKVLQYNNNKQKRSTEGCSKFKGPETRQVQERLVSTLEHMQREKEGDLTQSYDKTPYTNRKFENQRTTHTNATKNFDYTTIADRLRTVSWSNK